MNVCVMTARRCHADTVFHQVSSPITPSVCSADGLMRAVSTVLDWLLGH